MDDHHADSPPDQSAKASPSQPVQAEAPQADPQQATDSEGVAADIPDWALASTVITGSPLWGDIIINSDPDGEDENPK